MAKITLDEIIDAFIFYKPTLKMKEIKDYVFERRGKNFTGYASRYSFDQTIQKNVEKRCPDREGYVGESVFQLVTTGHYKLYNYTTYANKRTGKADDIISKLSSTTDAEDFEIVLRKIREVSIIQRNRNLAVGLKNLHDNECQLCGTKLKIPNNKFYSEVHHIKPLGQPHNGPDVSSNMIVVCPNCHVLLDLKAIKISKDKIALKMPHALADAYIDYHNSAM